MDGRDLLKEVIPNWNKSNKLCEIANLLPEFSARVINSIGYKFYGKFQLGAKYNLENFEHTLVSKILI